MQTACILVRHLPVHVELHRRPKLRGRPLVIVDASGTKSTVLDASPYAKDVLPGMPLQEALARCKDAVLLEADPAFYREAFERVLTTIEGMGADVEDAGLGLAYVPMNGLLSMFGGEARLTAALLHAVPAHLKPQVGVASGKFPAEVAAGQARPGGAYRASGNVRAFLALFSVGLLPVSWGTKARLHSFGLHTLGQIASMPVGPVQAQFGPVGKLIWELANGHDSRPVQPRQHEEMVEERLTFASPLAALEGVITMVDILLARAFAQPVMRGRSARICTLEGAIYRSPTWTKHMVFREPVGNREQAFRLVRHTLEGQPPPGPLEELRLILSGLTGEVGRQESLFADVRRREGLLEALKQLEARLGTQPPIFQIREVEPWSKLPERRLALVPYAP